MAPGGYAWWYLDALSEPRPDGSLLALTVIAFIGSVFSPYYAWARRRRGNGVAPAEAHNAVNVALYRHRPGRSVQALWAMTERSAAGLSRTAQSLQIGPSHLAWQPDGALQIDIDERTAPWPRRLRGGIRVRPQALPSREFMLDAAGYHHWQPIAPTAQVTVAFDTPALHWQGTGYLDGNHGSRPLARDFAHWTWSRAAMPGGRSQVLYDVQPLAGEARSLALAIDASGCITPFTAPPVAQLPPSGWGLQRTTRCDAGRDAQWLATLESGPFYSRGLVQSDWDGEAVTAVHESLDLRRFEQGWVQGLLPFRMPRWGFLPTRPKV